MRNWYEKFRWFFTSGGKLVIGGESAEQNEEVLKTHLDRDDLIMHTKQAGSPFSVIKNAKAITASEINEAAVFTASFSRAWREGRKKAEIHVFSPKQIVKEKGQKTGTFTVLGKVRKANAELKLALTIQKDKIRAVPLKTINDMGLLIIMPGKISKEETAEIIAKKLKNQDIKFEKQEILNALPAGSFEITEK